MELPLLTAHLLSHSTNIQNDTDSDLLILKKKVISVVHFYVTSVCVLLQSCPQVLQLML